MKPEPKEGFQASAFSLSVVDGSGSEDCFSIVAGMGNPLVQRKKKLESVWAAVENPAAGQPAPEAWADAVLQFSPALAAELDCCWTTLNVFHAS